MSILKIILYAIVALVALIVIAYAYYGGFKKIELVEKDQKAEVFVYMDVLGSYGKTSKYTDEVYYFLLNDLGIETYKGCGIFYDKPKQVEESKLRSEVGCILEEKDYARLDEIKVKYKVKTLEAGKYNVAEFPQKGMVSIPVGIMKVYPVINKHCEENKINEPITEIYDVPNKTTIYRYLSK